MSVWGAGGEKIVKKNDREYIYIIFIYTKYIYIMYTYIYTHIYMCRRQVYREGNMNTNTK